MLGKSKTHKKLKDPTNDHKKQYPERTSLHCQIRRGWATHLVKYIAKVLAPFSPISKQCPLSDCSNWQGTTILDSNGLKWSDSWEHRHFFKTLLWAGKITRGLYLFLSSLFSNVGKIWPRFHALRTVFHLIVWFIKSLIDWIKSKYPSLAPDRYMATTLKFSWI